MRTPPGEVVARTMDADRLARYTDRWVDFVNGLVIAAVTALIARTWLAGAVLLAVMVASALASSLGRRVAGRSAAAASTARARFGQSLVSALESVRTVKLAAATPQVHQHLREVDGGRVDAAVREHRVQALLDGVPVVMVQCGVVAAWAGLLTGQWELATALLVANAVSGFDWFGRVAGAVVTEAPGTRAWMNATSALAGGGDLMDLPPGVDLVRGTGPRARPRPDRDPLRTLDAPRPRRGARRRHGRRPGRRPRRAAPASWSCCSARSGPASPACSARSPDSSAAPARSAGTTASSTTRRPTLRPGRVAHVAQVPRVLSGTFTGNVALDHADRPVDAGARGGAHGARRRRGRRRRRRSSATAAYASPVGRCSASRWPGRSRPTPTCCWPTTCRPRSTPPPRSSCGRRCARAAPTVIGATSKAAALAQADRVVVLDSGRVVDDGPWRELSSRWAHLAG